MTGTSSQTGCFTDAARVGNRLLLEAAPQMNESERILLENQWLSSRDCEYLVLLYETFWSPDLGQDYGGSRVIDHTVFSVNTEIESYLRRVTERLRNRVQEFFGIPGLILESLYLAALLEGGFRKTHADNEKYVGGRWIPNHTPQRDYTAIVYLNSDFSGGDLCFPQHNVCVSPKRGLLVAFPSSRNFVHAVDRVSRGTRYTMPVWFTRDPHFAASGLAN